MNFDSRDFIEDELVDICKAMGYGVDIDFVKNTVKIKVGRKTQSFTSIEGALAWVTNRHKEIYRV
jgi:hypothetical protein